MSKLGEKMSFEEFEEYFWEYIPTSVISDEDIVNNREWADSVVYEAWRLHSYSEIDKSIILKCVENTIFSFRRFNPIFS